MGTAANGRFIRGSFASLSGMVKRRASVVRGGRARTCGWSIGAVASGPSRPTAALPTARQTANPRRIVRRRSSPRGTAASASVSTIPPLIADTDDALLRGEVERRSAALAIAEPRVLHAAEGHLRFATKRRNVHVEHPGLRLFGVPEGRAEIVGVDGRREAVAHGVRGLERRLEVICGNDADHRSEDLLLRERHPRVDLAEDRRLDEVSSAQLGARRRPTVAQDLRARALALVDLRANLPKLRLVDDRPHAYARLEAIAGAPGLGLRRE